MDRFPLPVVYRGVGLLPTVFDATESVLVSAHYDASLDKLGDGAAVVYDLESKKPPQFLVSDLPGLAYFFGDAIAVDGDVIAIGEPNSTRQGAYPAQQTGAVHIFERNAAGDWVRQQVLSLPATACPPQYTWWRQFGWSVAIDRDVIVVGTRFTHDVSQPNPPALGGLGHAVVYERVQGVWVNTACLRVPPLQSRGDGCWRVAVRGDRIVATELRGPSVAGLGMVHVFERLAPAPGNWGLTASLSASDGASYNTSIGTDEFGWDVDLSDDAILVGAPAASPGGSAVYQHRGAGYLFRLVNGQWVEEMRFWGSQTFAPSGLADAPLGERVFLLDDGLLLSVPAAVDSQGVRSGVMCYYQNQIAIHTCPGASNSVASGGALIEVRGSPVAGAGRIGFHGSDFPLHTAGMLLASSQPGLTQNPAGSAGNLCLGGSIVRLRDTLGTANDQGQWVVGLDLGAPSMAALLPILPGSHWTFQVWYRDTFPLPTSNYSEAQEVAFR